MSLFLSRSLSKRYLRIDALRQRFFSSSSLSSHTPPYIVVSYTKDSGTLLVGNCSNCDAMVTNKKVPLELFETGATIGASSGWVATLKKHVLTLQDDLNPVASDSNPKRISLPSLETLPGCQTQVVTNVSMSSSSPEEDDCVVAVKFAGPQLSLCHGSNWTNIRVSDPDFFTSRVMFSKRDQMFTLLASEGLQTISWDLHNIHNPKLQKLHLQNLPSFTEAAGKLIDSSYSTQHLVESPSGETFLVKRYMHSFSFEDDEDKKRGKTKGIMVFRLDQEGNAFFTKDIGDLCLFISKAEPFCLSASSYPDLGPGDVFLIDADEFGCFNVSEPTNTTNMSRPEFSFNAPYFIPPQKLDHPGLDLGFKILD